MTLYEIKRELEEALENCFEIDPETGEVTGSNMEKVIDLQMAQDEKVENTAIYIKNLDAEISALDFEIKKLTQRRNVAKNKRARVSDFLSLFLNGKKFRTSKVDISYRKSVSCVVDDIDSLPAVFVKTNTVVAADKSQLSKALKSGIDIPGAHLVSNNNIQIR